MNRLSNKFGLLAIGIILVGLIVTVIVSRQSTQTKQQASEIENINRGGENISNARNSDGTMGPSTFRGNFSNNLSADKLGSVTFLVSDPSENKPEFPTRIPPATGMPSTTSSQTQSFYGPQALKSLIIKIAKVEVHMAFLQDSKEGKTTAADHWETLDTVSPTSVDLVQLAQGGVSALGLTKLAPGQYTEVRFYISAADATLSDGTNITVNISGKDGIVRIIQPFNIQSGKNTTLILDFDAQKSVSSNANGYYLKPFVVKLLENQ